MPNSSIDLFEMFVRPPGELIYFLMVIVISLASLLMALGQRARVPNDNEAQRYTISLLGVVIAWMALLIGAVIVLGRDNDPELILPPLERAVTLITVICIGWAVLQTPGEPRSIRGWLIVAPILAVIGGYALTALSWADLVNEVDFNLSVPGVTWTFATSVTSTTILLIIGANARKIADAPLKLLLFGLLVLGFGYTLLQVSQGTIIGNYAGASRLAVFGASLLVPALIYRSILNALARELAQVRQQTGLPSEQPTRAVAPSQHDTVAMRVEPSVPPKTPSPVERESVQIMRALGIMLEDASPANMAEQILKAVIEVLRVDVAALLRIKDANYADVAQAYDRFMQRDISGVAINMEDQPTLVNCIERRVQRPLVQDRNDEELADLYARLDIDQVGPAYLQPLVRDDRLIAVLLVAMPYSKRELLRSEEELLKGIGVVSSSLVMLSDAANDAQMLAEERAIQAMVSRVSPKDLGDDDVLSARRELQASLSLAREQIDVLSSQVAMLKKELEGERGRVTAELGDQQESLSVSQRIVEISTQQQILRAERDALAARLEEAEAALHGAFNTRDEVLYKDMIEALQREKNDLVAQRNNLQAELERLRAHDGGLLPPDEAQDMVARMEQEQARLEEEKVQFQSKLSELEEQLKAVGVDTSPTGLARLIHQLTEQRATLVTENERLKAQRDRLALELDRHLQDDDSAELHAQQEQVAMLQATLRNVAGDREVALKQRDRAQAELSDVREKLGVLKRRWRQLEHSAEKAQQAARQSDAERSTLQEQVWTLTNERDRIDAERQAAVTERDQLLARIEGNRERVTELGTTGVGSLTEMINDLTAQRQALETELEAARRRIQALEQTQGDLPETESGTRYQPANPDLLLGLVQELRTPMTSIIGYVDLLLSESAGILGEMQRKFLQRVSTNVSRLDAMLEDLVKITELDTGNIRLTPVPINVSDLIDDAITHSANQFREKGLTVNLAVDDRLPPINVDRDAMSQIIGQLLSNAYLVSPPNSEITVRGELRQEDINRLGEDEPCLYVAVQDQGGGISVDDEARVFARKYKAENPLIQGLGDTGVGLSIARALVEAQGGHLWLESEENRGSTFQFLLPYNASSETRPE